MLNFSSFLENKKGLFFVFLFLAIFGMATPRLTMAVTSPDDLTGMQNMEALFAQTDLSEITDNLIPETSLGAELWSMIKELVPDTGKALLSAFVYGLTFLLITVFGTLANLASALLLWVMSIGEGVSYTHIRGPSANLAVAAGWPIVRDLANMIVVLGFIIIGIAFSLRIENYGSKKVLINLIIAALLINFSLMICGIVIDSSNMVMHGLGIEGGGYLQRGWAGNVWDQIQRLNKNFNIDETTKFVGMAVGMVFQDVMMFVCFMLYFFLFLGRHIALWILVILSPLAFVCYVFPVTKKVFDMWKSNFIQWCIIGIPATFFIFLSDKMSEALKSSGTTAAAMAAGSTAVGSTFGGLTTYLVPGMFLIVGFLFSLQSSAMGAGTISSAFKKYGMKTAKSAGSRLNELSNRTKLGQAVRDKASVAGAWLNEKTGGAKIGNVPRVIAERRAKAADSIKDLSDDQINARLDKSGGRGIMGAALVEAATSRKILGKGRTAQQANTLISNAEESGSLKMRSDATNSFVALAEYDKPKVKKIMDQHPGWTEQRAKHEAVVRAATKLPEESLDRDFVDSVDHTVIRDVGARLTNKKKEALRKNTRQSLAQEARTKPVGSSERRTLMNKLHEINNL